MGSASSSSLSEERPLALAARASHLQGDHPTHVHELPGESHRAGPHLYSVLGEVERTFLLRLEYEGPNAGGAHIAGEQG